MDAIYWVLLLVWGLVWGACSRQCVIDKGYEDEGGKYFAIGFFLGLLGFILAYVKPDQKKEFLDRQYQQYLYNMSAQKTKESEPAARNSDWRCVCGAMNREVETSCHRCGKTIAESKAEWKKKNNQKEDVQPASQSLSEQLKELKTLLDEGLINEEEFAAKKKQLLNIK